MDVRRFVAFFCVEEELASGFSVDRRHERTLPCKRDSRSEEHTSELQSPCNLVCRLLLEKKTTQCRIPSNSPSAATINLAPTPTVRSVPPLAGWTTARTCMPATPSRRTPEPPLTASAASA